MFYNMFWQKNLHISKKSSTFAPDLEKDILHRPKQMGQRWGATLEE